MTTPYSVANNTLTLSLTVQDQNATAIDLSGSTVNLLLLSPNGSNGTIPMTIVNAALGEISIVLGPTQTNQAGQLLQNGIYNFSVQVIYSSTNYIYESQSSTFTVNNSVL